MGKKVQWMMLTTSTKFSNKRWCQQLKKILEDRFRRKSSLKIKWQKTSKSLIKLNMIEDHMLNDEELKRKLGPKSKKRIQELDLESTKATPISADQFDLYQTSDWQRVDTFCFEEPF